MNESDADLLSALDEATDPRESPVATPGDVADQLEIGAEAVRQRLIRLAADDDGIMTRKVGRSRVFWTWTAIGAIDRGLDLADEVTPTDDRERADHAEDLAPLEQFDADGAEEAEAFESVDELVGGEPSSDDLQEESDDDLRAEVLDDLEESDVQARTAREALVSLAEILDERGITKTAELRAAVYDRHDDDYGSEKALWASIQPFIEDFEFIEDPGRGEWAPSRP